MAILRSPCTIIKTQGHDLFGGEILGQRKNEKCGIVRLYTDSQFTTVRVDSGASRGAAYEKQGGAKLLLSPNTIAEVGDLIIPDGRTRYRIAMIQPRYATSGKLDHMEIECGID